MGQIIANGIALETEIDGPADAPVILLTRGLGTQLIEWPPAFYRGLVAAGFRFVRYDNRDVGLSQKFGPCDVFVDVPFGSAGYDGPEAVYSLFDMAADTVGLLDALAIEKAHILGISMGGMISQIVAAKYPERARSLISIMSSAGEDNPVAGPRVAVDALWAPWPRASDRVAIIEKGVRDWRVFGSKSYPADEARLRQHVIATMERCYCPGGILRQRAAVRSSGSREHLLKQISCPSLIIHGDEDPLIPPASGERAARLIPDARFELIKGMGHDFPDPLVSTLVDTVVAHCRRVEAGD